MKSLKQWIALAAASLPCVVAAQAVFKAPPGVDRTPVQGLQPANVSAVQALSGEGLYTFSGTRMTNVRIAGAPEGNRHPLREQAEDKSGSFNGHIDVGSFVINGERVRLSQPTHAIPVPDGSMQVVYGGARPMHLSVRLEAFDVSGQEIRPFLRTARAYAMPEANRVGDKRFPPGSIAYIVHAQFLDDVLVLPSQESFSGATNTRALLTNFSRNIPYCLSYEDRSGAHPYALIFRDPNAQKGRATLYAAKPGTVFCAKASEKPIAEGQWEERMVAGTRAVVLSFGADVDPLDTGVTEAERVAASIAFVEPSKGSPGVRPGKMYRAGAAIIDHQFRFNGTAANAIRAVLSGQ